MFSGPGPAPPRRHWVCWSRARAVFFTFSLPQWGFWILPASSVFRGFSHRACSEAGRGRKHVRARLTPPNHPAVIFTSLTKHVRVCLTEPPAEFFFFSPEATPAVFFTSLSASLLWPGDHPTSPARPGLLTRGPGSSAHHPRRPGALSCVHARTPYQRLTTPFLQTRLCTSVGVQPEVNRSCMNV